MIPASRCAVVIPCLNEAASLRVLLPEVMVRVAVVVVVDDGSTDGTGEVAERLGAEVIRHESPRGKGVALSAGLRRAQERGFDWALCMDGDGQHSPADIPTFLEADEDVGLVVGNRMTEPSAMPRVRRWVNRWMSARLSRAAGRELPDSQCGFRLIRLPAWRQLNLVTRHFEVESEVLLGLAAAGERVEFVPIRVIYRQERSKIHPVRDTVRWFRWFWGRR